MISGTSLENIGASPLVGPKDIRGTAGNKSPNQNWEKGPSIKYAQSSLELDSTKLISCPLFNGPYMIGPFPFP